MTQPSPAYAFPGPIPQDVLEYFRAKGITPSFNWQDVWAEEHAASFTVAKAMEMDVLLDIRDAVDAAIKEGTTFETFQKRLKPTLQAKGWWGAKEMTDPQTGETVQAQLGSPRRLKTIFDANLRTARAAGQWGRIQRTKDALPYLLYTLGPSEHHRPQHVAWEGTCLRADNPWWASHFTPNGWGCKCGVRQVGPAEYARLVRDGMPGAAAEQEINPATGLPTGRRVRTMIPVKTTAPPVVMREWTNKRTGEVLKVPDGIDPGWDTNPGVSRQKALADDLAVKQAHFNAAFPKT